jgi:hypothetical protein
MSALVLEDGSKSILFNFMNIPVNTRQWAVSIFSSALPERLLYLFLRLFIPFALLILNTVSTLFDNTCSTQLFDL